MTVIFNKIILYCIVLYEEIDSCGGKDFEERKV